MTETLGVYQPGTTPLHRAPAGLKLLVLLASMVGLTFLRVWWHLALAAGVVALLFVAARIPARVAWGQLRPLRWIIPILAALQLWLSGWQMAVWVCGSITLAVAMAALLTLTTRVSNMLDAMTSVLRPLRALGVNPERISLLLAVTIRCIPLLIGIVRTVSEARKARGLGLSIRAVAAPAVIRSLRAADALGEALIARGADD